MDEWQRTVLKIETSNEEFYRCFSQGVQDMAALRLPLQGTDHMVFVPAAGLPWFVALFGRDTLIASLQTMIVYPGFAAGALEVLGQYQAKSRDDYRDAEPGKILHELRYGELAYFKMIPHTPYYGTADADRAAFAECRSLPDLDRQIRRSRWRRVSRIPDALDGRLREYGVEGFRGFSDAS